MSKEILACTSKDGGEERFVLEVFQEGEHGKSDLSNRYEHGEQVQAKVAPRFYGVRADQARRRMLSVLENQYDDVKSS